MAVHLIIRRLKLSRRVYEHNQDLVQIWLEQEFPKTQALAKKTGATLCFSCEAGVRQISIPARPGHPGAGRRLPMPPASPTA